MTDKNKYVLAEIKRLRGEFAEAGRMFCLAYDDEVRPDYNKRAAIYGKDAAMHWGNELCAIASMFHSLTGRLPEENPNFGSLMPVNPAYRRMLEAGELEGKERDEIERLAFA